MNSKNTDPSLERRREMNRQAAQKMRNRQKLQAVKAKQEYFNAKSLNTQLDYSVRQMRKKKEELDQLLQKHLSVCLRVNPMSAPLHHSNSHPILTADIPGYSTVVVTSASETGGVLQLVPLNSLVGNRLNLPGVVTTLTTLPVDSSSEPLPELGVVKIITPEYKTDGDSEMSGNNNDIMDETASNDSSINFNTEKTGCNGDSRLSSEETEPTAQDTSSIENYSPQSRVNDIDCKSQTSKLSNSNDPHARTELSSRTLEARPTNTGTACQLPLVLSGISDDED